MNRRRILQLLASTSIVPVAAAHTTVPEVVARCAQSGVNYREAPKVHFVTAAQIRADVEELHGVIWRASVRLPRP